MEKATLVSLLAACKKQSSQLTMFQAAYTGQHHLSHVLTFSRSHVPSVAEAIERNEIPLNGRRRLTFFPLPVPGAGSTLRSDTRLTLPRSPKPLNGNNIPFKVRRRLTLSHFVVAFLQRKHPPKPAHILINPIIL
jgi:hypothetical protein